MLSGEVSAVKAEPAVPTETAGERERPETAVEASEEPVVVRTRGGVVEPEPEPPEPPARVLAPAAAPAVWQPMRQATEHFSLQCDWTARYSHLRLWGRSDLRHVAYG